MRIDTFKVTKLDLKKSTRLNFHLDTIYVETPMKKNGNVEGQKSCRNEGRKLIAQAKRLKRAQHNESWIKLRWSSRVWGTETFFVSVVLSSPFKFAIIKCFLSFLMENFSAFLFAFDFFLSLFSWRESFPMTSSVKQSKVALGQPRNETVGCFVSNLQLKWGMISNSAPFVWMLYCWYCWCFSEEGRKS